MVSVSLFKLGFVWINHPESSDNMTSGLFITFEENLLPRGCARSSYLTVDIYLSEPNSTCQKLYWYPRENWHDWGLEWLKIEVIALTLMPSSDAVNTPSWLFTPGLLFSSYPISRKSEQFKLWRAHFVTWCASDQPCRICSCIHITLI